MTKTCAWIALALISGIASLTLAHGDERKLLDRIGPYEGTGWVASSGLRGGGGQFDRSGVELLSWLTLSDLGGSIDGNDCWGYVSPSGREYALVGFSNGFAFVEITDPINPQLLFWHGGNGSTWRDIKVIGDHAYGVTEAGGGIFVYDMSNIDDGTVTFRGQTGSGPAHNIVANPDTGFIYRTGGNGPGLRAYDAAANPNNPPFVGSWNDFYVHDAQVVVWQNGPLAGRELAFCCSGTGNGAMRSPAMGAPNGSITHAPRRPSQWS